jgi:bisphosphoglycerate-independent phosphoglycerate mutase (AlkP superfamily)
MTFRTVADLRSDNAVFMDFTNRVLIERGVDVFERTEAEAAEVLARIIQANRFTLYEYFITDKIGHAQDFEAARTTLQALARFIRELLNRVDLDQTSVILTSDHGNIEDLSSRNHTLNQVPTIVWGKQRNQIASQIRSLADITPAIVAALTNKAVANS